MRVTSAVCTALAGSILAAAPLAAQGRPLPLPKPPTRAQQGSAGPAQPQPVPIPVRRDRYYRDRSYPYNTYDDGSARTGYPRRAAHWLVPYAAQVSVDHSVYANFGQGLVYVPTRCSAELLGTYGPASQPYADLETTQPVPRVQSSTAQAIREHPGNAGATATGQRVVACWAQAPNGAVTVYRYY
ncbi:MAG TPA: hypothetical protein VFK16_11345 [Gemmatimonadaceae bacterium]|jgi:hypothetical protein|nr:hypothetical protein [Gemmatimonadaceae bacterium]